MQWPRGLLVKIVCRILSQSLNVVGTALGADFFFGAFGIDINGVGIAAASVASGM